MVYNLNNVLIETLEVERHFSPKDKNLVIEVFCNKDKKNLLLQEELLYYLEPGTGNINKIIYTKSKGDNKEVIVNMIKTITYDSKGKIKMISASNQKIATVWEKTTDIHISCSK